MTFTIMPVFVRKYKAPVSLLQKIAAGTRLRSLWSRITPALLMWSLTLNFLLGFSEAQAQALNTGAVLAGGTGSDLDKSNQSKVFFHDGKWWALAIREDVRDWFIWKHDANTNTWAQDLLITTSSSRIPDVVLDAANNRLFIVLSNDAKPDFIRLSYVNGAWLFDSGFPLRLSDFVDDDVNRVSLVRAQNGDLWLFRIASKNLQAKRSANNGASWSAVITIKSGLNNGGVTDAAAFTSSAGNCVGVVYGESDISGGRFGFLIHKDSDAENVWNDESANLTLTGSVRASNELCMTADAANNVFLLTQNLGATGSEARNTLFKRSANGSWQSFSVNTGTNWISPAIALHPGNGNLHVMGINTATGQGEYKICAPGSESGLAASAATILFASGNGADNFADLSVPASSNLGAASKLMICVDNMVTHKIWFNELGASGTPPPPPPAGAVTMGNVTLSNSEANANASYTIPVTLGSSGALTSNSGTITLLFPSNTFMPNSIASSQVSVNGASAANVAVNNTTTREVTITTPVDLANEATVSIVVNAGAGLLNPSVAGNYTLQARTSVQTTPGTSPNYAITAASTQVSAATVTPNPTTANTAAAYTVVFNLGARGRLLAGTSTITLTFNNATTVTNGSLSGVLVNGASATAMGNSAGKSVSLTAPASLSLDNNAAITIVLPASALTNPASGGSYTLTAATSVETSATVSNAFTIDNAPPPSPSPTGDDYPISGSAGGYNKPNQNRPFYHDGYWWTAARKSSDGKWYLWKLSGSNWSAEVALDERSSTRPDCYMDSATNKLYILLATTSGSGTRFTRLSYSGGTFSIDSGFPVTLSNFTFTGEYCMVLTKAKNGELWVFRYRASKVDAMKSSNDGANWSSVFTVKSGIESSGLVDAVTFSISGDNYVGVGFGENTGSGTIYGFLKHKDGDADGSWSDETGDLPALNDADSDDHISLTVSPNNEIYFVVKTHPGGGSSPGIALYKRSTGGNWSAYTIQTGGGWTRPAVVVDETNNEVYVMGTQEGSPEKAQYKKCAFGNESSLASANAVDLMDNGGYNNISVPRHAVTGTSDLLVCAEDQGGNEVWYAILPLAGGSGGGVPPATGLAVTSVAATPNTANLAAEYTIALKLGSSGELNDDSDAITITWPEGTTIPASIPTNTVIVNGDEASAVSTTPASRQVAVTISKDLSNGENVTMAFSSAAGLVNPSAGNYTLQARTSVEPANVTSPSYTITAEASSSPLVVNSVSVTPDTVTRTAQYTISLTLGNLGALNANSGTITVTFPNGTTVPASMANTAVLVNGASAANVSTNPASRQATVTVPNALANSANVTLIFESSAGLVNPSAAGDYALQVRTSVQTSEVGSPNYNLKALPAPPPPSTNAGSVLHANTNGTLDRSGQGKLFYFQNTWWVIAFDSTVAKWHLWKYASGAWTRDLKVDSRAPVRIDAVLDSTNGKLYYVASHEKNTRVGRLAYAAGTWTEEMVTSVADFGHGKNANAVKLARAKNGELWLFRMNVNVVEAKISTDNGASWSAAIAIKSGLTGVNGMVDGLTFTVGGVNRIGVIYGMTAGNGGNEFGFLHHEDGAGLNTWVDETTSLTFFGNERGENWFNAQVTPQGAIYLLTRNSNAAGSDEVWNTLYVRTTTNAWQKYKVNVTTRWNYPIVAIDASGQRVYVLGVRNDSPNFVEYKFCTFGNEAALEAQTATPVLKKDNHNFGELAGPMRPVYANAGLMLCGANVTTNDVWFNHFIPAVPKFAVHNEEDESTHLADFAPEVSVYPNPFNPATTIRFRVHESARVRLRLFDVRGALVRNLFDRDVPAGMYESRWNGKDREGQTVASGLYFYRLEINDKALRGSLHLVK